MLLALLHMTTAQFRDPKPAMEVMQWKLCNEHTLVRCVKAVEHVLRKRQPPFGYEENEKRRAKMLLRKQAKILIASWSAVDATSTQICLRVQLISRTKFAFR
eukprot:TRINITY_DN7185_c1_g1_i4.p2 TRINITY_DN7185_c1_g1~~TRINITY_DN7185_c1_g1_i4.p2  ORF type:complete len:102 (-),score=13.30 TRINITY_DN7185_c1_g1_i4:598-903(-)